MCERAPVNILIRFRRFKRFEPARSMTKYPISIDAGPSNEYAPAHKGKWKCAWMLVRFVG